MSQDQPPKGLHFHGYLLAGLLTITPLVVVWLVFDFFLGVLSQAGHPMAAALAEFIEARAPAVTPWLSDPRVQFLIAVVVALLMLYLIGAIASRVLGARLIALFERIVVRIPLAYYLALDSFEVPIVGTIEGLGKGLYGCWLAMSADIAVRGVFFMVRFARGAWKSQKV